MAAKYLVVYILTFRNNKKIYDTYITLSNYLNKGIAGKLTITLIIQSALNTGRSIRMIVFKDHPNITKAIANDFPETLPKYK